MRPILLNLGLFHPRNPADLYGLDRKDSERVMRHLLSFLYSVNRIYLREHPGAPLLYDSGIRYAREDEANPFEEWMSYPVALEHGECDCEELGTIRAAELSEHGVAAEPQVSSTQLPDGNRLYHVTTRRAADRRILPPGRKPREPMQWHGRPVLLVDGRGLPVLWAERDGTWTEDPSRVLGM